MQYFVQLNDAYIITFFERKVNHLIFILWKLHIDILENEPLSFRQNLSGWLPQQAGGNWSVCWRATRDGWDARNFHSRCDRKKPTLTLVKVGVFIFGGYATESLDGKCKLEIIIECINHSNKVNNCYFYNRETTRVGEFSLS